MASLKLHDPFKKVSVQYDYKSLQSRFIQPPKSLSYQEYDDSLNKLLIKYQSVLNSILKGESPDAANPLTAHLAKGTVIFSDEKSSLGVPLILPESVMQAMEKYVAPIDRELKLINKGFLVPYYRFFIDAGKLEVVYKVVSNKLSNTSGDTVLHFEIATFGQAVIQAFDSDWTSEFSSNSFSPNEFLIQALYGKLIHKDLGLPGRWGFDKTGQKPEPVPIPPSGGLYSAWAYMFEDSEKLSMAQRQERGDALVLAPRPGADFLSIASQSRLEKDKTLRDAEYKRLYHFLSPLLRLYSNLPDEHITNALEEHFGLIHPDRISELYDHPEIIVPDEKKMKRFFAEMLSQPGCSLLTSLHHQKQLDTMEAWFSGILDALPAEEALVLPELPRTKRPVLKSVPEIVIPSLLPAQASSSAQAAAELPSLQFVAPTMGDGACALHAFLASFQTEISTILPEQDRCMWINSNKTILFAKIKLRKNWQNCSKTT